MLQELSSLSGIFGFLGYLLVFGTEQCRSKRAEKRKTERREETHSRENDSLIMGCVLLFPDGG